MALENTRFGVHPVVGSICVGDLVELLGSSDDDPAECSCICEYKGDTWSLPKERLYELLEINKTRKLPPQLGRCGRYKTIFEVTLLRDNRVRVRKRVLEAESAGKRISHYTGEVAIE